MAFIGEIIYLKGWGIYIVNIDGYKSIGNHWIAIFIALELNIFQKKSKFNRKQKYQSKNL